MKEPKQYKDKPNKNKCSGKAVDVHRGRPSTRQPKHRANKVNRSAGPARPTGLKRVTQGGQGGGRVGQKTDRVGRKR